MSLSEPPKTNKESARIPLSRNKTHTAVSLPIPLYDKLCKQARDADRSLAKQIEHYMRIGASVDTMLPSSQVDKVKNNGKTLLDAVADLAKNGPPQEFVERVKRKNPSRIHFKDDKAYLSKPDGTVLEGRLSIVGDFIYERTVVPAALTENIQHHSV